MEVKEVNTGKEWNRFLQLPFRIFKKDPYWVPPLLSEQRSILDTNKNPYFRHCLYKAWLVLEDSQPVGRILAYIDTLYNDINNTHAGFFGFFECIDQQQAAEHLFDMASQWLKQNGINLVYGPMNFSIGNECGVQLSGFEFPPVIQMNHTPVYYQALFENAGFSKAHDLYAYRMTDDQVKEQTALLQQLERLCNKTMKKHGLSFRTVNLKNFAEELVHVHSLFNDCMNTTWGFVPATMNEILFAALPLKKIADQELIFFAEVDGKVVGCSISVPDINQAMRHIRNGKLFPLGIVKLLYYLPKIDGFRLLFLGVHKDYRLKGLDALFYYHTIKKGIERGYKTAELSWISEDNWNLIKIVEKIGAVRYKTYRMYRKDF